MPYHIISYHTISHHIMQYTMWYQVSYIKPWYLFEFDFDSLHFVFSLSNAAPSISAAAGIPSYCTRYQGIRYIRSYMLRINIIRIYFEVNECMYPVHNVRTMISLSCFSSSCAKCFSYDAYLLHKYVLDQVHILRCTCMTLSFAVFFPDCVLPLQSVIGACPVTKGWILHDELIRNNNTNNNNIT